MIASVIGYASSGTFRPKAAYDRSVETSVVSATGRAWARRRAERSTWHCSPPSPTEPVHRAYAGVALPNDASVRLHERSGFTSVGIFSQAGFKFGRYVDVQWFERALP